MAYEHKGEFQVEHGFGLPVKTTAERNAYTPNRDGYQVYDSTLKVAFIWADSAWVELAAAADAAAKVSKAGDTMTGELVLSGDPTSALGATPKSFVEAQDALKVSKAGDTMSGNLVMGGNEITGLPATPSATGATSVEYVDGLAVNYATAAQGTLADTALQDITGESIGDLSNVDTTTAPTTGQALVWNGTDFAPSDVELDAYSRAESDGAAGSAGAKTDKVSSAVSGNFAGLDATGNLTDSGSKTADFATAAQGALADTAVQINTSAGQLSDINVTGATQGQALVWDNTAGEFKPADVELDAYSRAESDGASGVAGAKIDKIDGAVDGNFPAIDANGELTDSGKTISDFATDAQGALADTAVQPEDSVGTLTDVDLTGVATDNALTWDGTKFTPYDLSTGFVTLDTAQDITATKTFDKSDVVIAKDVAADTSKIAFSINDVVGTTFAQDSVDSFEIVSTASTGKEASLVLGGAYSRFKAETKIEVMAGLGSADKTAVTLNQGGAAIISSVASSIKIDDTVDTFTVYTDNTDIINYDGSGAGVGSGVLAFGVKATSPSTVVGDGGTTLVTKDYMEAAIVAGDGNLYLDDLNDVDTTTNAPATGEALVWDGTNFVPTAGGGVDLSNYVTLDGDQTLTGLKTFQNNRFVVTDSASNSIIDFNSTGNATVDFGVKATAPSTVAADSATTLTTKDYVDASVILATNDLTDVDESSPAAGHVLINDGTSYKNRALVFADVSGVASAAQGALADSAFQPGDATSTLTNNDAFVDLTTNQTIVGEKTFTDNLHASSDVTIAGDLTVSGTTTHVNSTNTEITDSIITLNKGETAAGVSNPNQSGLEIDRGTELNKFLIWSEANDRFGSADPTAIDSGVVDTATFEAFALASEVEERLYKAAFNTGDWTTSGGVSTFTVLAATHGIDTTAPIIYDVTVFEGTEKVGIETTVNASGDVTLTTAGSPFAGAIRINL